MSEITHAAPACNRFKPKQPPKTDFSLLIKRLQIYGESALDHDLVTALSPRQLAAVADALEKHGRYPYQVRFWLRTGCLTRRGQRP